ncbi:M20 family metallopeptidase [Streptomyces chartreusis]
MPTGYRHPANALAAMLADAERLITCESPSRDLSAVASCADTLAALGVERLGTSPERIVVDGHTHLRWRFGSGPAKVLVLGHYDTVWPLGTLTDHPFSVSSGILRGPGCFDMKAGLVQALHALASLDDLDGVTFLATGDEEIGSPTSRELIETEAMECDAVLVLEASADGGALKTARKGAASYKLWARGRAAHAGLEPEKGINAGIELAHQILAISTLGNPAEGTTVTPTVATAGITSNTIPAEAVVDIDVRARTARELHRVDRALRGLCPVLPCAVLALDISTSRPPLEASSSTTLFALAQDVAAELGLTPLACAEVGGASDGNLTAGVGTPTLDGLGAVGGGAHAPNEYVLVAALPSRTALLAGLIRRLLTTGAAL